MLTLLVLLMIASFVLTVTTGPAGREYLDRRRQLLDAPKTRVVYLPSRGCRVPCEFCGDEQCFEECINVRTWTS